MEKQRKLNEEVISCIMSSMLDLLKTKEFEKISIIEIIEHAGVSRNSFYRDFSSKENILVRYVEHITEDFIKEAAIPVFKVSWKEYILAILQHMYRNKDLVEVLLRNNKLHLISNIFDSAIYKRAEGQIDKHHIWFLSGGLFNLHQHWAANGYKESPENIADSFNEIVLGI